MNQMVIVVGILGAAILLGVFVVVTVQQAEAIKTAGLELDRGCNNSIAFNASMGRCFRP